jgi:hypothetical protein
MSVDGIGRDRACAAPKVKRENSQAKGPVSDETLESRFLIFFSFLRRRRGNPFKAENLSGKKTGTRWLLGVFLFFLWDENHKGE